MVQVSPGMVLSRGQKVQLSLHQKMQLSGSRWRLRAGGGENEEA